MRGLLYHGSIVVAAWLRAHWMPLIGALIGFLIGCYIESCQAHGQTIANALAQVNAVRAQRGVYPLTPALDLQAQAEWESIQRARSGIGGHLPNGCKPGRAEGVGWQGGSDPYGQSFNTCFHTSSKRRWQSGAGYTTSYRYAGAAVAVSPSGRSYYTLILR